MPCLKLVHTVNGVMTKFKNCAVVNEIIDLLFGLPYIQNFEQL